MKISSNTLDKITENNYLEKSKHFSGRFIVIFKSNWLYTDSTSSFSIYFDDELVSNNLSLIYNIKYGKNIISDKKLKENLIIPPKTYLKEFNRLIPGQKLNLLNLKPKTITNFFELQNFSIQELKFEIKKLLISTAQGIEDLSPSNYLHMLTGGRDSRISLLSFLKATNSTYDSYTHLKFKKFYNINDKYIVKRLIKNLRLKHMFTFPDREYSFAEKKQVKLMNPFISEVSQEGSTWFYYKYGNMQKLKKFFLIDHYYEIGRMHFQKNVKDNDLENYLSKNLNDTDHIEIILNHIHNINSKIDPIDLFYFIKNYVNVANQLN